MKIASLLRFGSKLVSTTVQAHPIGLRPGGKFGGIGDSHRLIMGEFDAIQFPVTFKQHYGKKLCDVLDTGHSGLYLISDRMKTVLADNNLTGRKTFIIRLLDKDDNEICGYHGLSITGRCGPINISKSEVIQKRSVPTGPIGKFYKGLHVGLDEWDGSDFFLPENNYGTIITAKAAEVIKSNKLTNIRLTSLADIEISEGHAELIRQAAAANENEEVKRSGR